MARSGNLNQLCNVRVVANIVESNNGYVDAFVAAPPGDYLFTVVASETIRPDDTFFVTAEGLLPILTAVERVSDTQFRVLTFNPVAMGDPPVDADFTVRGVRRFDG